MPDVSGCVRISPDGRYILATGTYKPRVKCYEVAALSLKFERCFDSEVIQFEILSDDYSKVSIDWHIFVFILFYVLSSSIMNDSC